MLWCCRVALICIICTVSIISCASKPAVGNGFSYDAAVAKRMLLHSDATYCGDDHGHGSTAWTLNFSCYPCQSMHTDTVSVVGIAQGGGRDAFAYVAVTNDGDIVIAFRGSVLPKNYEDDGDAVLVPWARAEGALVHRGFVRSYESIRDQILNHVSNALTNFTTNDNIFVTGHSLGAAQSTLAAVDLAAIFPSQSVIVYNFGDLRVGDEGFVKLYNNSVSASYRVVHHYDPVPQIIPRLIYRHIPREVWYHDDSLLNYTICDGSGEDHDCQDSVPRDLLTGPDHDFYLHHAMWCCIGFVNSSTQCNFPFPNGPN